jgi:hypothetical protein
MEAGREGPIENATMSPFEEFAQAFAMYALHRPPHPNNDSTQYDRMRVNHPQKFEFMKSFFGDN